MSSCLRRELILLGVLAALGLRAAAASPPRALDPQKELTQYGLDVWTTDEGLPNATVNAVLQTRDGYLWLATYDGLARFDGLRFTVFHTGNTPALANNGIRALVEGADGSLWIGTNGGGLARLRQGRFDRFSTADGLPSDIVWALHSDVRDGSLWIGTNGGGLARLKDGRFHAYPVADSGRVITSIAQDRDGSVWVACSREGLRRLAPDGRWTAFPLATGRPGTIAGVVRVDASGNVWAGTVGHGLARLDGGVFVPLEQGPRALRTATISALLQDGAGTLWIGTNGSGLARYRDGAFDVITASQGLPQDIVYSLFADQQGSLWFGTHGGGLGRLRDGRFQAFTARDGLTRDFVYVAFEDRTGTMWAGTAGGLYRLEGRRWIAEPFEPTGRAVRSIAEDRTGALWVGTYGAGVWRRQGGRWTAHRERDGLAHDSVRAVLADRGGRIWAATVDGLSVLEQGRWRTYRTQDGLPKDSLIAVREDRSGAVWVGTDGGGLCRLRDGRFEVFTARDGLASNSVLALYEDADGTLWVGTNGGLSRFGGTRFDTISAADGLPSDSVAQILDDGMGHLWIGTSRGVSRLRKASLAPGAGRPARLEATTFGRADGLGSSQCTAPGQPAGMRGRDGRLWFSTTRGLAVVDPARLHLDTEPPPVAIEEVMIDGRSAALPGPVVVPAGASRLQFRYTGLSLLDPNRLTFRFRLQGFEPDWVDARSQRLVEYTGLPPGDYVFRVTAANPDGFWNEAGTSVQVRIHPRLYQTRWFLFGGAALVTGLVALGHRLRLRRLEAREQALRLLVEERTHKLVEEKQRAERAGREAAEADAFKTELLGIAAHDLRNPLTVVRGSAELIQNGGLTAQQLATLAEGMHRASEHMLGLIDALLTTAALERGTLELHTAPVDVGRLAARVVEDNRPLSARKQQSLEIAAATDVVVEADEGRLHEVIENLVSNGIKFSPAGGRITVTVQRARGRARLEVRDQGPGLSDGDKARLFRVFARLSARPTGGESSTGIGLSIVKRLVELHGGRVWAESAGPGAGATFVVELPAGSVPSPSREAEARNGEHP